MLRTELDVQINAVGESSTVYRNSLRKYVGVAINDNIKSITCHNKSIQSPDLLQVLNVAASYVLCIITIHKDYINKLDTDRYTAMAIPKNVSIIASCMGQILVLFRYLLFK